MEIHIELISLRNGGETNRVEHHGKKYDDKYNLGLTKGHHFINDYTELTSHCLENYEEVKDIKNCNRTFKKYNDKHKKCNDRFIKALQAFTMLVGTGD